MIPFAVLDTEDAPIVLLGLGDDGLVGLSYPDGQLYELEPEDILTVVSIDPVAVFGHITASWASLVHAVANKVKKRLPKFVARGQAFPLLPEGVLSGFPVAARTIRHYREVLPSIDAITVSTIFAVSTVRTRIEQAELAMACFGELYKAHSRKMPSAQDLTRCFQGLQNQKAAMFSEVAAYAPTIRQAMDMGYRDRELRSVLALDTELPTGLGLAKLSFTLALLGHDTVCLDGRLLGVLFDRAKRTKFEAIIGKERGRVSEHSLLAYEAAEDAFLTGNRHYDPNDPLGRARTQWMSWEGVGRKGAKHEVWLNLLPEND